ncbi:MAG: hypothetical protein ACMXYD_05635 [Candidatus Woesearchaeota archaeon]
MALSEKEIRLQIEEEKKIHVLITFEMVGKPRKHVEETLQTYTKKLQEDPNVVLINSDIAEAAELEEEKGFFSAFSEVEMLLPNMESLTSICVNLMPASIEILGPDSFTFEAREIMNWENDLLARLHEISQTLRAERQKTTYLVKNMHALIHNTISVVLAGGARDLEDLSRLTGVPSERLEKDLAAMKEKGVVTEDEGVWQLKPQKT